MTNIVMILCLFWSITSVSNYIEVICSVSQRCHEYSKAMGMPALESDYASIERSRLKPVFHKHNANQKYIHPISWMWNAPNNWAPYSHEQ